MQNNPAPTSTTLSRTTNSDISLSMSKRLCELRTLLASSPMQAGMVLTFARPAPARSLSRLCETARRYKQPIFLSVDLPFLSSEAGSGVSSETSGRWTILLEKLLVQKLDGALRSGANGHDVEASAGRLSMEGDGRKMKSATEHD